ncbi:hypothetical protein L195_g007493, partial [Trifolium pratense]
STKLVGNESYGGVQTNLGGWPQGETAVEDGSRRGVDRLKEDC